jgi:hemerythrin
MGEITWERAWELGVETIDADHRRLVETLNAFIRAAREEDPATRRAAALGDLLDHACRHFAREERLMERLGVPGLAEHARVHRRLEAQVRHIRDILTGDSSGIATAEVEDFLTGWLTDHLQGYDRALRPYIVDGGAADRLLRDPPGPAGGASDPRPGAE